MPRRLRFSREEARSLSPSAARMGLFRCRPFSLWGLVLRMLTHSMPKPLVAAALSLLFSGVTFGASQSTVPPLPTPPAFRQVTDELGRRIRVPQPVHRIVSLAPNLTETIYALGLQDRLVGDTDYCDFPPEAQQKPKVGGAINPSLETIASLHPDLVLVTKNLNRLETVNALDSLGIPSYATDPHTVEAIIVSIEHLADLLGVPETGAAVGKEMERTVAAVKARVGSLPPRRVLFVVWTEPLISIGKDTFIADALQHAGAVSVIDSSQNWPQINLEEVVRLQPDFLIFAEPHPEDAVQTTRTLADLPGWRILDAVKHRRFAIVSDAVNRPAPRITSSIEDLARQLHPEAFVETQQIEKDNSIPASPVNPAPAKPPIDLVRNSSSLQECACAR
jgi:iron complex transport system substrate-binding protein